MINNWSPKIAPFIW